MTIWPYEHYQRLHDQDGDVDILYSSAFFNFERDDSSTVYDLSNPTSPSLIGTYEEVDVVHDAFVINDTAYLNCGNEGLKVVKFNDIGIPIQLGELNLYIDKGYNHSACSP